MYLFCEMDPCNGSPYSSENTNSYSTTLLAASPPSQTLRTEHHEFPIRYGALTVLCSPEGKWHTYYSFYMYVEQYVIDTIVHI